MHEKTGLSCELTGGFVHASLIADVHLETLEEARPAWRHALSDRERNSMNGSNEEKNTRRHRQQNRKLS